MHRSIITPFSLKAVSLSQMPVFGIISGAGPEAGAAFLNQIIRAFQQIGAWKDAHYPIIHLVNFPFADMLTSDLDPAVIRAQLAACLNQLEEQCDHMFIACQTLHNFLPITPSPKLISLFDLINKAIHSESIPLVLASRTSVRTDLHGRLLNRRCEYYDAEKSQQIIDEILKGHTVDFSWLDRLASERPIILGCTEYSAALEKSTAFIDPIKLAVQKVIDLSRSAFVETLESEVKTHHFTS